MSNVRCHMKSHFAIVLQDDAGTNTRIKNKLSGLLITLPPFHPSRPSPLKVTISFASFPYFIYCRVALATMYGNESVQCLLM